MNQKNQKENQPEKSISENNQKENLIDYKFHLGHRKRAKERFFKLKADDLEDYELLEILLFSSHPRSDVKPLAKRLIAKFGNIKNIVNAQITELKDFEKLNDSAIISIKIIKEIMIRSLRQEIEKKVIIGNWKALLDYCQIRFDNLKHEELRILFLNRNQQLIKDDLYQTGSIESVTIDPIAIVKKALLLSADSLILIHNHPSGNIQPSKADIDNTNKISEALKIINIKILDHLIIGQNSDHYSFKNNGLIFV